MAILQVEDIQKRFGRTRVLEDISFSLEQGQAMAIIGSSGSGKTTLLRCLNFLEMYLIHISEHTRLVMISYSVL